MAFYAIKGGEEAIKNSLSYYNDYSKEQNNINDEDLINTLTFSIDKVISEASLYSKKLAA